MPPDIDDCVAELHEDHRELYSVFKHYVTHEDDLTNNRLNWNFAIQGFLFFSWAYCLQKFVDLRVELTKLNLLPNPSSQVNSAIQDLSRATGDVRGAMTLIAWVGLLVSALIFFGALAAQIAIKQVEHKWQTKHKEYSRNLPWRRRHYNPKSPRKWNTHGPHLPGLIGGGSLTAHILGFSAPLLIPVVFVFAWLILLLRTKLDLAGRPGFLANVMLLIR